MGLVVTKIVEWLDSKYGENIEYGTVYGWVRYRFGASLKVSRPKSCRQDESAVGRFNKKLGTVILTRLGTAGTRVAHSRFYAKTKLGWG